jgi:hypothetical protein
VSANSASISALCSTSRWSFFFFKHTDNLKHAFGAFRIELDGWSVKDKNIRSQHYDRGQNQTLLLVAGQLKWIIFSQSGDAGHFHGIGDPFLNLIRRYTEILQSEDYRIEYRILDTAYLGK